MYAGILQREDDLGENACTISELQPKQKPSEEGLVRATSKSAPCASGNHMARLYRSL
jgi:hypothetical protein